MRYLSFLLLILFLGACNSEERQLERDIEAIGEYLDDNGLTATSTASGLHYIVVKEGTGTTMPDITSVVTVKYRGELLDGRIFEKVDEEINLLLSNLILGWQEGIQLMKKGAIYQFLIPSALAYGENGNGNIEGDTPLFFEIELIDFVTEESIFQDQLIEIATYADDKGYDYEVTASGLHYVVVKDSASVGHPAATSEVVTNYRGEYLDGEVFDENTGLDFALNNVIAGWTEGLQLMTKGDTYYFIIPSRLGYGPFGRDPIPGNTPLFFEVTLLDFN